MRKQWICPKRRIFEIKNKQTEQTEKTHLWGNIDRKLPADIVSLFGFIVQLISCSLLLLSAECDMKYTETMKSLKKTTALNQSSSILSSSFDLRSLFQMWRSQRAQSRSLKRLSERWKRPRVGTLPPACGCLTVCVCTGPSYPVT